VVSGLSAAAMPGRRPVHSCMHGVRMWHQPQHVEKLCRQASIAPPSFVCLPPTYCCRLNRDNHALHPPAVVSAMTGQVEVSVALQVG
jgi:hypothetical protein